MQESSTVDVGLDSLNMLLIFAELKSCCEIRNGYDLIRTLKIIRWKTVSKFHNCLNGISLSWDALDRPRFLASLKISSNWILKSVYKCWTVEGSRAIQKRLGKMITERPITKPRTTDKPPNTGKTDNRSTNRSSTNPPTTNNRLTDGCSTDPSTIAISHGKYIMISCERAVWIMTSCNFVWYNQ